MRTEDYRQAAMKVVEGPDGLSYLADERDGTPVDMHDPDVLHWLANVTQALADLTEGEVNELAANMSDEVANKALSAALYRARVGRLLERYCEQEAEARRLGVTL